MPVRKLFTGPEDRRIKRALCIVAHPDDIEFYCGGTVLKMTRRGVLVDFVLATSGDKGSHDSRVAREELATTREEEQAAAAYVLGVKRVNFLRHPDAELTENLDLRRELVREIRATKPDVLRRRRRHRREDRGAARPHEPDAVPAGPAQTLARDRPDRKIPPGRPAIG